MGDQPSAAPLVSVVAPVYHNARSLSDLHARLAAVAAGEVNESWEFVFVDDGSRDDSLAVLMSLAEADARVRVVQLAHNFGSHAAVLAGLSVARGDAAAIISADLQDPPELIATLLAHWRGGSKVVLAARLRRDDPWSVRLGAWCFYTLFRALAAREMPRGGFDCCLLDRQAYRMLLNADRTRFLPGEIVRLGFAPAVVGYERGPRLARYGPSMWTLGKRARLAARAIADFGPLGSRTRRATQGGEPPFVIQRIIEAGAPLPQEDQDAV